MGKYYTPQTTLVKLVDGRIADEMQSILQRTIVVPSDEELAEYVNNYGYMPKGDTVKAIDGTVLSRLETIISALNSGGSNGGTTVYFSPTRPLELKQGDFWVKTLEEGV